MAVGSASGAPAQAEPRTAFAATDACPTGWPVLNAGAPGNFFDGNVSVLAGGSLYVAGTAAGAEGLVVALGNAGFARQEPGSYEVGATSLGSQVTPYANSDMLVVGGVLAGDPATRIDVGQGLGADVAVGGDVVAGTDLATHGGTVDTTVGDATKPYTDLPDAIAAKSATYAVQPATGLADVTDTALTLTGDGVSNPQIFTIDAATLAPTAPGLPGRSLQVLGIPAGAAVVVNLVGPAVDMDIDALLSPDGTPVDPTADAYFADLATHLVWNIPGATTVDLGGLAQLPGSVLVPSRPSTTTLSGAGTNGRVLVGGDLVHMAGQLHSYPFLPDPDLSCLPQQVRVGSLTLDLRLDDPDHVVADDQVFEGRFACDLDGDNVTPADDTWRMRAGADTKVLSDQIPAGAVCTLTQKLDESPAPFREWGSPVMEPDQVVVAKRRVKGFTLTNRVRPLPPVAETPTPTPTPTEDPEPPPVEPTSSPTPSTSVEPSDPADPTQPSAPPTVEPSSPADDPAASEDPPPAAAPGPAGEPAGPLTTTTPFTLRGSFVWVPPLVLSLLTLMLRIRRRPKPERLH